MVTRYIIGHWTAGAYSPCIQDLQSYQLLIDSKGRKYNGKPQGQTASTGGMNSITYNVSCCGGLSHTPIKPEQIEAFYKACAAKIKELGLTIDKFYTHAEIGEMVRNYQIKKAGKNLTGADCNGKLITDLLPWNNYLPQNVGKIDLRIIPNYKGSAIQTGDFIRNKIKWYLEKL